jgi:aspartate/methionine/tyrosine aminotransferase
MVVTDFSDRAQILKDALSYSIPYFMRMSLNRYDETTNPSGIINFGVAENMLCESELVEKLNAAQKWLAPMNYYGNPAGEKELRQELCNFFEEHLLIDKKELTLDRMMITSGASGGFVTYCYMLANPGDAVLIPSPYYTMIDHYVSVLTANQIVRCPLLDQDTGEFRFTVDIFRRGYDEAVSNGLRPRIIILVNPQNPLGDVYDEATVRSVLEFAAEKQLHVIIDEIYAFSLFTTSKPFKSILSYTSLPDPARTHFLWSFSKDFTLSGTHVGVMYAGTAELCAIATRLNFFWTPARVVQQTLASLLADREWIRSYIELNRSRLTEKFQYVKLKLESMGIQARDTHSGFFIWADFRPFMKKKTFEEENQLFELFFEHGLYVSRGYNLGCSQPGWIRLVFTLKDSMITEGLKRMKAILNQFSNEQ